MDVVSRIWVVVVLMSALLLSGSAFAQGAGETAGEGTEETAEKTEEKTEEGAEESSEGEEGTEATETTETETATEETASEETATEETAEETANEEAAAPAGDSPAPAMVLGLSGGVTAAGVLTGALLAPGNETLGNAILIVSIAVLPSVGNILLKDYKTAGMWAATRIVGGLLVYAGLELLTTGAADASDSLSALGVASLWLGAAGVVGGMAADMGKSWSTAQQRQRATSAGVTSGWAVAPRIARDGSTGLGVLYYRSF